ncbi:MAG: hypothetical protein KAT31_00955 [Bacteroidales bacterium]|nr:hypothetical protein [Bacteroidales bacterium]
MAIVFSDFLRSSYSRILSQVCRDENSSLYGCFDRNFWHYKIRDFSSIILQQGGYLCYQLSQLDTFREHATQLEEIARASALFWNQRAKRKGAFEEYYPWEKGYPPMAFSTLSVARLVFDGIVDKNEVLEGLKVARRQLCKRFEFKAANQQMAGLAALAFLNKIDPDPSTLECYDKQKSRTLALQDPEGWFNEYDGPDLGYLSVTLDCLWDLYDITEDDDFLQSIRRALMFMQPFTRIFKGNAGMHNARNTDYLVPYGIVRNMFQEDKEISAMAREVFNDLYQNPSDPDHFFHAVDDRYLIHYIGHSIARAEKILNKEKELDPVSPLPPEQNRYFANAGYQLRYGTSHNPNTIVSIKKGGILSSYSLDQQNYYHDFGWILTGNGKQYITHWWSDSWEGKLDSGSLLVKGFFVPHSEKHNSPGKHFILRTVSFIFGNSIIEYLKSQLIFKKKKSNIRFIREITFEDNSITIVDEIQNIPNNMILKRAPRSSKRHVSSADSFHPEDFSLWRSVVTEESRLEKANAIQITTSIQFR